MVGPSGGRTGLSFPAYRELARAQHAFTALLAWTGAGARNLETRNGVLRAETLAVTGNFHAELGVTPVAGRLLRPEDDQPGAPLVAVLGHGFWQRALQGDPSDRWAFRSSRNDSHHDRRHRTGRIQRARHRHRARHHDSPERRSAGVRCCQRTSGKRRRPMAQHHGTLAVRYFGRAGRGEPGRRLAIRADGGDPSELFRKATRSIPRHAFGGELFVARLGASSPRAVHSSVARRPRYRRFDAAHRLHQPRRTAVFARGNTRERNDHQAGPRREPLGTGATTMRRKCSIGRRGGAGRGGAGLWRQLRDPESDSAELWARPAR